MDSKYSYKIETKRKSIKSQDKVMMSLNMKYPVFKKQEKEYGKTDFLSKINRFYSDSVNRHIEYIEKKGKRRVQKDFKASGEKRTAFVMVSNVSYLDENYISVFTDVSYYDGNSTRTKRISHLWDVKKGVILPPKEVFNINAQTKKYIRRIICDIAEKNMGLKTFSYFDNYKSIVGKHFNFSNYYIVPKGIAFYFNSEKISSSKEASVFVIPFEKIDGVTKLAFSGFPEKQVK